MPNKAAKDRKRNRLKLNKKLSVEGRTSKQHRKWLSKNKDIPLNSFRR